MAEKKSFIMYTEYLEVVDSMDNEAAGQLFKAILGYAENRVDPDSLPPLLRAVFIMIRQDMDRNSDKWQETCSKRRDAANKRWEKERCTKESPVHADNANAYTDNANACTPVHNVNVNGNANVNANVNESVNEYAPAAAHEPSPTAIPTPSHADNPNNRKRYGEYGNVTLADGEISVLNSEYGEAAVSEYIKRMDVYCRQHGKAYADCFAAIKSWLEKDKVPKAGELTASSPSYDIDAIFRHALNTVPTVRKREAPR